MVVAAVQGHAIGAGCQLALAADLRVVADDAQFAMRETSLGLVPDLAGTTPAGGSRGPCPGPRDLRDRSVRGRRGGGQHRPGERGRAAADLEAATSDLVAALLATPEAALRELKPLLRTAASESRSTQLRLEREAQSRLLHGLGHALR